MLEWAQTLQSTGGEFVAVIGPNGRQAKLPWFRLLLGLQHPISGTIKNIQTVDRNVAAHKLAMCLSDTILMKI